MYKINCNVDECSFNSDSKCMSARVNIGGTGAKIKESTSCGTFLDKNNYSDLSQSNFTNSTDVNLHCAVNTCKFNCSHTCSLEHILVSGIEKTKMYTETNCESFQPK